MKKIRFLSIGVIVILISFLSYFYLNKNNGQFNLLAIDYSGDSSYGVVFSPNGGNLVGFDEDYYTYIRNNTYGIMGYGTFKQSEEMAYSHKGTHYIIYWSLDPNCSTKDLSVGASYEISKHTDYYACFEETNFSNDGIRYVLNDAYVSGDALSCGDEIHITQCYKEWDGSNFINYCDFDQINGKSANGKVYRDVIKLAKVTNCQSNFTAYYHEPEGSLGMKCGNTIDYDKNVCSSSATEGESAYTPNTSSLMLNGKKFIGWAADNDGKNVNCSGKLVNSESVVLSSDVHYYACFENVLQTCENSDDINDGDSSYEVKVCYNASEDRNGDIKLDPLSDDYDEILECADGYTLDKVSRTNIIENTCTSEGSCYKVYDLSCIGERPKVLAESVLVGSNGYGTITFKGVSDEGIKGWYASTTYQKPTKNSKWEIDSRGVYDYSSQPGAVFLWVMSKSGQISYAAMASVIDKVNTDTTLEKLDIKTSDGKDLNPEIYSYNGIDEGISSSDYVRLSNNLKNDSKVLASGFNPFETAYKVTTSSDKIAVYATLTSEDASYVEGYEPRTVSLNYGVNTILIKIQNKKGNVRTYTIIVTREDDRDSTNILKSLYVSEGNIQFDAYKSDYVVSVGKNEKSIDIKAELFSNNSKFVDGNGPRKIQLNADITTESIKVVSETGSIRSYNITFVKKGKEITNGDEALLSSLSLSNAFIAFDKNIYDYNTSVDYEIDSININAIALNGGDSITIYKSINGVTEVLNSDNILLNVGRNDLTIVVATGKGLTRKYSINILRKENGLDVSSDTKLSMLDVNGYDIEFNPEKYDYKIKIKREKTLVIAATPISNRSEVYIRGNDNLTAFSIVKIKVIAEDGQFKEYTIDIQKDAFNRNIEMIGLIGGFVIIICGIIIIRVKKKRKSINDYYAE